VAHPLLRRIFDEQDGVATRPQLAEEGWSWSAIRAQIDGRRWQELNEHVVVNHNGPLTHRQRMWAAYLSAPQPAAMCGLTAMAQWGVTGYETEDVHIVVRRGARLMPVRGLTIVVHESRRLEASDISSGRAPAATSLRRATVDAASWSRDTWTSYRLFVAPIQQRRETASALREELLAAGQIKHRRQLIALANDLCGGAQALSEVEFLRFCRRHGLPQPKCQRRMDSAGRWRYLDATFRRKDGSLLRVEIDGGIHLSLAVRSRDTLKDNDANLSGKLVLRYASAAIYADDRQAVAQIRRGLRCVSG
jgi:hypothetical protein